MKDQITDGICSTCGKELSGFELFHERCTDCVGFPVHQACGGQGCTFCYFGEIRPIKNNLQYEEDKCS